MIVTADVITPYRAAHSLFNATARSCASTPTARSRRTTRSLRSRTPITPSTPSACATRRAWPTSPAPATSTSSRTSRAARRAQPHQGRQGLSARSSAMAGTDGMLPQQRPHRNSKAWSSRSTRTPSVAFSGMAFYTGDKLSKWKNLALHGRLSGQQLVRLELDARAASLVKRNCCATGAIASATCARDRYSPLCPHRYHERRNPEAVADLAATHSTAASPSADSPQQIVTTERCVCFVRVDMAQRERESARQGILPFYVRCRSCDGTNNVYL